MRAFTALKAGIVVFASLLGGLGLSVLLPVRLAENPSAPAPIGGVSRDSPGTESLRTPAKVATKRTLSGFSAYAATVAVPRIEVRKVPHGSTPAWMTLADRNQNGAPQTFLIKQEQRDEAGQVWYRVLLPVRPNGTAGWIRGRDVRLTGLRYRLEVHLASFRLELFNGSRLVESFPIGVGTDETPTPGGEYYVADLLKQPDPDTVYGSYVFDLNGYSNGSRNWTSGGMIGIHGTNDPEHSLGRKVSRGCIRMRNEDIERLVRLLPLGTPVEVEND
jgi:lipoprotein-anchoring transpeptidase ErfK/SrfK